jgi:hypothetical protein
MNRHRSANGSEEKRRKQNRDTNIVRVGCAPATVQAECSALFRRGAIGSNRTFQL